MYYEYIISVVRERVVCILNKEKWLDFLLRLTTFSTITSLLIIATCCDVVVAFRFL